MEGKLDESRANIIREAIKNDGTFCGTEEWLESHYISRDEFEAFLEYPVLLAKVYEYRGMNKDTPAMVETKATFKPGALKRDSVVLKVEMPPSKVAQVQTLIDEPVYLMIYPEQLPLPLDEGYVVLDERTGEVING